MKRKEKEINVAMITLSREPALNERRTIKELEKYEVARLHYYPPTKDETEVEAVIIGLKKFPKNIVITNNKTSRGTPLEEFTERQRKHL